MVRTTAALLVPLALAARAAAAPPEALALPLACTPGEDCWVLRYVDHDPGPGARDYRCGALTGDGHNGTDIAIRDLAAMAAGVEVRAAVAGTVEALRDGMEDTGIDDAGRQAIAGKECGNGIRLAHGDGWTTWYCHLRRGSLMVKQGDAVKAGQPLALVGLSGDTSFPHLHFDVRRGDEVIDPFVGTAPTADCSPGQQPLWTAEVMAQLAYRPVLLTNANFATAAPQKEDVRRGWHQPTTLPVTIPALILWAEGYWLEPGDRVRFQVFGPKGYTLVDHAIAIEQGQQRWLGFAGTPRHGPQWPAGTYAGKVVLERATGDGAQRITLSPSLELRELP